MIRRVAVEVRVLSTGHCGKDCPWLRLTPGTPHVEVSCTLFEGELVWEKETGYQRLEVCEDADLKKC